MSKCETAPKPKPTSTPTFIDVPTAARIAGYSTRHFSRLIAHGADIKFIQIGRKFWVLSADLDQWITNNGGKHETT